MATELNIYFYPKFELAVDSGDHTTYNLHGYSGQASPTPTVYVNGVFIAAADYTFNVGSSSVHCSITFDVARSAADAVKVSYKWLHACDEDEDVEVYKFTKPTNAKAEIDINGRNMVTEAYNKFPGFHGVLTWPYPEYLWWDEIRRIAENPGGTIDVERVSFTSGLPVKRINNLYVMDYPEWEEEAGVVDVAKSMTVTMVEIA